MLFAINAGIAAAYLLIFATMTRPENNLASLLVFRALPVAIGLPLAFYCLLLFVGCPVP
jgi:hypothetical protein